MHKQKLRGMRQFRELGICAETGKRQYSEKDARTARRRLVAAGEYVEPYRCHACHLYHLGHPAR